MQLFICSSFQFAVCNQSCWSILAPTSTLKAIEKAKRVFLDDCLDIYRKSKTWHKTTCIVEGHHTQCLVLPPRDERFNPGKYVGLMFHCNESKESLRYYTHDIVLKDGRPCDRTRLKVRMRGEEGYKDPFDVNLRNGKYSFLVKLQ